MQRRIVTLTATPRNPVSRLADRRVMRRQDYKETKLSRRYRLWYVLAEKSSVQRANDERCYFAINQETGIKSYIAVSDVENIHHV